MRTSSTAWKVMSLVVVVVVLQYETVPVSAQYVPSYVRFGPTDADAFLPWSQANCPKGGTPVCVCVCVFFFSIDRA